MCELTSPLDDETALHIYMQGLKEHIGVQVHIRRPTSLEDMIVMAERVDQAMMAFRRPGQFGTGQQLGVPAQRGGYNPHRAQGQRYGQQFRGGFVGGSRGSFGQQFRGVGRPLFGGSVGRGNGNGGRGVHFGNVSQYGNHGYRGPAPMVLGAVQDLVCYGCGQPGHIRRNCPQAGGQAPTRGMGSTRAGHGGGARGHGRSAGQQRGQQWANVLQSTGFDVTEELHNILQLGAAAVHNQTQQRDQSRAEQASGSGVQGDVGVSFANQQQEN